MFALAGALRLNYRRMRRVSHRAHQCYRYYLYWRSQERIYRNRSAEQLLADQMQRLREMLMFVNANIPFYRDRLREASVRPEAVRTRDDLRRIPVLTKDDIRQNFPDRLVQAGRKLDPSQMGRTSGSTSQSLHFVRPDESWRRSLYYSVLLRRGLRNLPILMHTTPHCTAYSCSLLDQEDPRRLTPTTINKVRFFRHMNPDIGMPSHQNILTADDGYMENLHALINSYSPCVMIVDPMYFGAFARYLRRTGRPAPDIRSIISTYELLTGSLRDLLHEVFGCEIYTQYGCSEIQDIANECDHHRLHVRMNNVLVEVLRGDRPARPGELGRVVVTDLDNRVMPFLRYEIGDVVVRAEDPCPCGRHTETLEAVHGRTNDLIRTADGRLVTPLMADAVFRGVRGIAAYRLVQRGTNRYTISLMPDRAAGEPDTGQIVRQARAVLGDGCQIRMESVDSIAPQPSKKFRCSYSEIAGAISDLRG